MLGCWLLDLTTRNRNRKASAMASLTRDQVLAMIFAQYPTRATTEPPHPRERGWIIVHPLFPLGFKHCLDPHQQRERVSWVEIPWLEPLGFSTAVPLVFRQTAIHNWAKTGKPSDDSTGGVLWRAAEALAAHIFQQWSRVPGRLSIIELGCGGCALPSLSARLCGHKVVATDLTEPLELARLNIDENVKAVAELKLPAPPLGNGGSIDVHDLWWGEPLPADMWWGAPGGETIRVQHVQRCHLDDASSLAHHSDRPRPCK